MKYKDYEIVTLRERKDLNVKASIWFNSKWHVEVERYLECINAYINNETELGWYLCLDGEKIIAGLGVIENDFHERKDLTPNVCAVYTENEYRNKGIAGKMLNYVVEDCRKKGISPLYLITDHDSFYERYGWQFFCNVKEEDGNHISRLYIHK